MTRDGIFKLDRAQAMGYYKIMKTLKQEWLDRAKEAGVKDPDPNVRMCQAFAHFDGPGWTKFAMAALIIDLSEQLEMHEDNRAYTKKINEFYEEWNAKNTSN